jgi:hypothetical protein
MRTKLVFRSATTTALTQAWHPARREDEQMQSSEPINVSDDAFKSFFWEISPGMHVQGAVFMDFDTTAIEEVRTEQPLAVPSGADRHREGGRGE